MRNQDKRGDTPRIDGDDNLEIEVIEHPFQFREFADQQELTNQIVDAINLMGGAGESAEEAYRQSLARLARRADEVGKIVQVEYFDMPEEAYLDRWSLVMLVVELLGEGSVDFFNEVIARPIPEERSKNPHSFSTVGEEVMIRTTAIEGLERLAAKGDEAAIEVLFRYINHDVFSIRRAATQALIATGDEDMRRRLADELPKEYQDLLEIRRVPVQEAEQAEGGLFVKSQDSDSLPPPNEDDGNR